MPDTFATPADERDERAANGGVMQIVRFESTLSEEEVLAAADARLPPFRKVPGLIQKYYIQPGEAEYGGVYIWESREAMMAYRESALFKSIGEAYGVKGTPKVEIIPLLFPLR